jgi:hypothetical protein
VKSLQVELGCLSAFQVSCLEMKKFAVTKKQELVAGKNLSCSDNIGRCQQMSVLRKTGWGRKSIK